ncbi:MAG TPA: hypothetical protein DEV81_03595 [Cyanobacteria bacterium UBA11049]|nr:hypothetical protein [Cyanobacteria bacterium UBA11049]
MLKLTYIETGFYLERLAQSLEEWVTTRVIFALRVGDRICLEPSTASFLLPADLPRLNLLVAEIRRQGTDEIVLCACDAEYVEVGLQGTWIATEAENAEGVFVAALSHATESLLFKLWQDAQISATVMSD